MARFLDYYELVIVMLVILLFDLNAFCFMTIPSIINNKPIFLIYYISLFFIMFDIFIVHNLLTVKTVPETHITYKVDNTVLEHYKNENPIKVHSKDIRRVTVGFIISVFMGLLIVQNKINDSHNLGIKIPLILSIFVLSYYFVTIK